VDRHGIDLRELSQLGLLYLVDHVHQEYLVCQSLHRDQVVQEHLMALMGNSCYYRIDIVQLDEFFGF